MTVGDRDGHIFGSAIAGPKGGFLKKLDELPQMGCAQAIGVLKLNIATVHERLSDVDTTRKDAASR
jgi:hypothetical protein